LGVLALDPWYI